MREKLQLLMKNEGLTQSRLAEILEIQPAGVSHILAGRNKPGFDLLQKILRRFPQLNPDWLLLDSDRMYRTETVGEPAAAPAQSDGSKPNQKPAPNFDNLFAGISAQSGAAAATETPTAPRSGSEPTRPGVVSTEKEVARIIVLYTDRSFESFTPQK